MMIEEFNALQPDQARELMLSCCHSNSWAESVVRSRPFQNFDALMSIASINWFKATEQDILDSFRGHARIGDLNALRDKYSVANAEQGQVGGADEAVLADLLRMNREYEEKNGFIFIICASGKSAEEMRDALCKRLSNDRETELNKGASEQEKITRLRLLKMFKEDAQSNLVQEVLGET